MKQVFKLLIIIALAVSFAGCAFVSGTSSKPTYPTPLNDEMKAAFSLAEQSYQSGNLVEASRLYQSYIRAYGYNELTDASKFKLGEIAFSEKKYETAISYYREAFQNLYNPEIAPKAQFKAALSLAYLKRFEQSLSVLDIMDRKDMGGTLALRVDSLGIRVSERLNMGQDSAIKWYLYLLDDYSTVDPKDYEGKLASSLVDKETAYKVVLLWSRDANVTMQQVDALPFKYMKGKSSGGFILYKKAMVSYAHGNFDESADFMKKFLRGYPKHEFASEGELLLAELKGRTSGKRYKLGVVLPLSGRFEMYGKATLHGVQCAAGLTPPCTSAMNVELIVKDSAGDPVMAAEAVKALAKEGVIGIVGPLLSATASSAANVAQEYKIPLISLSQKEGIIGMGNYVFRLSLSAKDQIDTLVDYGVHQKKLKKFGILYPSNNYGSQFATMFRTAIAAAGAKIVYEKPYSHEELRTTKSVKEIGAYTNFGGAVVEGITKKFAVPSDVQAIFIPDSYKAVRYIVLAVHTDTESLSPNLLYMGVNRWNNPGLTSHDIGLLEGSVFVDGFFKSSADVTTRHFVQSFLNAFGMEPTILEAQAYDALKILLAGISNGGTTATKLAEAVSRTKNLGGVTGNITITENGDSTRRLFILTVKNGMIAELSSARGMSKESEFSYSAPAKANSEAKYEGTKAPDLTVRTDLPKYESADFYGNELE